MIHAQAARQFAGTVRRLRLAVERGESERALELAIKAGGEADALPPMVAAPSRLAFASLTDRLYAEGVGH